MIEQFYPNAVHLFLIAKENRNMLYFFYVKTLKFYNTFQVLFQFICKSSKEVKTTQVCINLL